MNLDGVKEVCGNLPWMTLKQAETARSHCLKNRCSRILELGHMHGVSTCYFASIAKDFGGRVVTVDFPEAAKREPNAESLLEKCGLTDVVTIRRDTEGAAWALKRMIDAGERFDFAYIDAGHTIECAGLLFVLSLSVIEPGGWVLFDDLNYRISQSVDIGKPWFAKLTDAQKNEYQVLWVWENLVKNHPLISFYERNGNWGFAQKRRAGYTAPR